MATQYPDLQVFGDSVAEELAFAADQRGGDGVAARDSGAQLLAELGIGGDILSRSTWALSSGERRLVQVTSALVTPASAVALDEPTCGLDATRGRALAGILRRAAQSVPLAIATQDPELPRRIGATVWQLGP